MGRISKTGPVERPPRLAETEPAAGVQEDAPPSSRIVIKETTVTIKVPGSVAYRETVLDQVAALCRRATASARGGVSEHFVDELVSAVGEAFNNIAIHAYDGETPDEVHVELSFDGNQVTATLRDFGKGFDLDAVKQPDLSELPESGMGVYIMRSCVDGLSYQPGHPNTLTLRKMIAPEASERDSRH